MKLHFLLFCIISLSVCKLSYAQYEFSGYVNKNEWPDEVYLSIIEDYRKILGIYPEQIIQKIIPDSTGYFEFAGDNLPITNRIYRIQVDNCSNNHKNRAHLNGVCTDTQEILFIANNNDKVTLPFTFDKEMFCKIVSNNEKSNAFIKVDSIIDEMRFAFGNYRSKANHKINSTKWIKTLQEFGKSTDEPLVELRIYAFLSNKTNELYSNYLEDLKDNTYYDELLGRLQQRYPNSVYTQQYEKELASDKFLLDPEKVISQRSWSSILLILLILSTLLNIFLFILYKRKKSLPLISDKKLTPQEQKILDLILQDKTNKEIATSIYVSVSTVKTHINNLYKKLGTTSREEVKNLYINK
ncbi:helix-turn-helix transcriptional regulator [Aquimarina sp. MMG016]|uniref:response regulator transcription factor n=1 Tax=Aquimarina sp. MMG016 TaxID=2822690 RepID=UPI001B39F27A|nr:helix-turn-helix transcriptional regulator [Aquimarina sp. MMG016]MBQ4822913.1 helix-turn-helix transcriptional regulator [Aquimarina sp. MMG016]